MKRFLIASVAITALVGTPALAADMAVKAPLPAPAPVANWNGCYVGANGGAAWGWDSSMTWADVHPGPGTGAIQYDPIDFGRSTTSGGIVGGQVGCNWQASSVYVLGLEGDADWTNLGSTARQNGLTALGVPQGGGVVNMSEQNDFLASVRGRAGFLWGDKTLFYATGGVAWTHEQFNGQEFYPNTAFSSATSFSRTPTGWVAGVGVEQMFQPNWLLRFEFLYYGFNGTSSTVPVVPAIALHPANIYGWGSTNIAVARLGLSYKFW
jgi:outer membrane immunogenic protein